MQTKGFKWLMYAHTQGGFPYVYLWGGGEAYLTLPHGPFPRPTFTPATFCSLSLPPFGHYRNWKYHSEDARLMFKLLKMLKVSPQPSALSSQTHRTKAYSESEVGSGLLAQFLNEFGPQTLFAPFNSSTLLDA